LSRVTVRVRGLAQAQTNMRDALANIQRGTEQALDNVAGVTQEDAQTNCPVGTPESTGKPGYVGGTLQASIQVFDGGQFLRQVGTDVYYGPFVHNGTYKMAARPFLTNAFEADQGQLVAECQSIKVV